MTMPNTIKTCRKRYLSILLRPLASLALLVCALQAQAEALPTYAEVHNAIAPHANCEQYLSLDMHDKPAPPGMGAILLPVELDQHKLLMQLDTGSWNTMLYGRKNIPKGYHLGSTQHYFGPHSLTLAQMPLGQPLLEINDDMQTDEPAGTLGVNALTGHVVVLDIPASRICVFQPGVVPDVIARLPKADGVLTHGSLLLPVRTEGFSSSRVLFDTGTVTMDLLLAQNDWSKVTGLSNPQDAPYKRQIPAWDETETVLGGPIRQTLHIGDIKIAGTNAYIDDSVSDKTMRGLIGLSTFANGIVVMDLTANASFRYVAR